MAQKSGTSAGPDMYDEEFNRNLLLAKTLVCQLKNKRDKQIVSKWITKLCEMKSNDLYVKKNRNAFFKYLLTVLHRGVEEVSNTMGFPHFEEKHGDPTATQPAKNYMSRWSPDKRTYVAVKPMPGKGALVYMAVAKEPWLGWEYHK